MSEVEQRADENGTTFWVNTRTQLTGWTAADVTETIEELVDGSGTKYFYNPRTAATGWSRQEVSDAIVEHLDAGSGLPYFTHTPSGTTGAWCAADRNVAISLGLMLARSPLDRRPPRTRPSRVVESGMRRDLGAKRCDDDARRRKLGHQRRRGGGGGGSTHARA